jgi:hypothetical protein
MAAIHRRCVGRATYIGDVVDEGMRRSGDLEGSVSIRNRRDEGYDNGSMVATANWKG